MPKIKILAGFTVNKVRSSAPNGSPSSGACFNINNNGLPILVTLSANEQIIEAMVADYSVDEELHNWLNTVSSPTAYWPKKLENELETITRILEDAARQVVESVKYFFNRPEIPDNVLGMLGRFAWFDEALVEHIIPIPPIGYSSGHSSIPLLGARIAELQHGLDAGFRPLIGMRHLFRAMQEEEPRFRWIDTTIALELSIKEALIRKCPELETLLLEVPSPPLDKLYNGIMKTYLGEASPYIKNIKNGVAVRNRLMHRPDGLPVSKDQAGEYVAMAYKAITHLFSQLYPEWPIARNMSDMFFFG